MKTVVTDIADPSEPVFLLVEDLVIHFASSTRNKAFDSVLQAYKNGSYLIPPEASQFDHSSNTSLSSVNAEDPQSQPQSNVAAENDDESFNARHEFDPYSAHSYPSSVTQWPGHKKLSMTDSAVQDLEPQTPSAPPSRLENRFPDKFVDFSSTDWQNIIAVQTSFRAFLHTRFPAGETGYSQHYFPVGLEADRLWKPVWGGNESGGSEGTVDQIIALDCEEGVTKDFFALISGQVQKLGTKRDGLNRSGRLDLRYLIPNAMQRYSTLHLGTQTSIDPLSNPSLLATLLVPHLEAYLATNTDIRLLILTYSAPQLSIVIALRKIIGQDILKIGGILNSLSSDPPSFASRPRTSANSRPLSNEATSSPHRRSSDRSSRANSLRTLQKQISFHRPVKSESSVSFSKADYLLPSIATDAEITNFLSAIWMSLMDKSPFYSPEPEPVRKVVEKIVERFIERPEPPPTPSTPHSHRGAKAKDSRETKISRLTGGDAPSMRARGHRYAPSTSSTMRTTGSEKKRKQRKNEEDWENFYIGEVDSEDDAYDRMIMGQSESRIVRVQLAAGKKRSSKKALKWLGLA